MGSKRAGGGVSSARQDTINIVFIKMVCIPRLDARDEMRAVLHEILQCSKHIILDLIHD